MISPQITKEVINNSGNAANFLIKNSDNIVKGVIPAGIGGILGVQTYVDVKNVESRSDKRNTIINNVLIGTAMVAGGLLSRMGVRRFLKKHEPGRISKAVTDSKLLKGYPAKEFFEALSIPIGAGIAGGVTGELAQQKFPVDNVKYNVMEQAGFIYDSFNKVSGFENAAVQGRMDGGALATMVGFSVGREKGVKNKIKKFVFELISGAVVPLALILPITGYLNKIIPEDAEKLQKMYKKGILSKIKPGGLLRTAKALKGSLILGAGVLLSMGGRAVATWFNRQVTENVIENKVWVELSAKQKELIKLSSMTHSPFEKMKIMEDIRSLTEAKEMIKNSGNLKHSVDKIPAQMTKENV